MFKYVLEYLWYVKVQKKSIIDTFTGQHFCQVIDVRTYYLKHENKKQAIDLFPKFNQKPRSCLRCKYVF